MKPSRLLLFAPAFLSLVAAQQTIDPLSVFVSEAYSVYTQVTSILASAASAASAAAATSTSETIEAPATSTSQQSTSASETSTSNGESSSASSESSAPVSSSSSSTQSTFSTSSKESSTTAASALTLSSPTVGTTSILGAAAETSTSSSSSSASSHDSNLPIILGCVLGALTLGLFILTLVICCKRRQRGQPPRHRALSLDEDEVDSWRVSRPSGGSASRDIYTGGHGVTGVAPLMSEHPAFRNQGVHDNPFVPVPPPQRRTAPNSRAGLTDGTVPGDDPFLIEKEGGKRYSSRSLSSNASSQPKGATATRLVGAATGAGPMRQHNQHKEDNNPISTEKHAYEPVPQRHISRKPVPVNHINNSEPWPYSPVSPLDPSAETTALTKVHTRSSGESRRSLGRDAARANAAFDQEYAPRDGIQERNHGLGTGATGLAAGDIGDPALAQHDDHGRSRSSSRSHSPRRTRPTAVMTAQGSDDSSSSETSKDSHTYSDALASLIPDTTVAQPEHNPYEIPLPPRTRSRRNSALGTAAPSAAAFSYVNRPTIPSPLSSEVRRDRSYSPPRAYRHRSSSGSASGNSTRHSLTQTPDDYAAYPPFLTGSGAVNRGETFPDMLGNSDKGIVGDNGYPHLGVPRRKSGGEYDFTPTEPLGPQTVPPPALRDERAGTSTMRTTGVGSDDSTWRLSSGMPGGWQRERNSPRNSRDYRRDSGGGMGTGTRRRLRASDFTDIEGGPYGGDVGVGQAY